MDKNKLVRLVELKYQIFETCNMCQHGQFKPGTDFGTCAVETYEHQKHTGPARQLSINRYGVCDQYHRDEVKFSLLGAYQEFIR